MENKGILEKGVFMKEKYSEIIFVLTMLLMLFSITGCAVGEVLGAYEYYGPKWSPDGTKILFGKRVLIGGDVGGAFYRRDLYVMDADGKNIKKLASDVGNNYWPPVENKIAYIQKGGAKEKLMVVDCNGHNRKALDLPRSLLYDIKWSPKGDKILCDEFVVNVDGSGYKKINVEGGKWSPDGTMIASSNNYKGRIYFIGANGKNKKYLINAELMPIPNSGGLKGYYMAYDWSPDSNKIAYAASGDENIYIMDIETNTAIELVKYEGNISSITWLPNEDKIRFKVYLGREEFPTTFTDPNSGRPVGITAVRDNYSTYTISTNGTGLGKIEYKEYKISPLEWPTPTFDFDSIDLSPDGTKYVYEGETDEYAGIYVIDTDGKNCKPLLKTKNWKRK